MGAVVPVDALGLNLAVFRGESGKVFVTSAYCPHLGANVAIGGRVRGGWWPECSPGDWGLYPLPFP